MFLKWLDVLNFDNKDVSGFSGLNLKWASQIMDSGKINILHVIGAVIIANLTSSPINALYLDNLIRFDRSSKRDIWMPSVMETRLLLRRLLQIHLESCTDFGETHLVDRDSY